jgi:hypothetical protein
MSLETFDVINVNPLESDHAEETQQNESEKIEVVPDEVLHKTKIKKLTSIWIKMNPTYDTFNLINVLLLDNTNFSEKYDVCLQIAKNSSSNPTIYLYSLLNVVLGNGNTKDMLPVPALYDIELSFLVIAEIIKMKQLDMSGYVDVICKNIFTLRDNNNIELFCKYIKFVKLVFNNVDPIVKDFTNMKLKEYIVNQINYFTENVPHTRNFWYDQYCSHIKELATLAEDHYIDLSSEKSLLNVLVGQKYMLKYCDYASDAFASDIMCARYRCFCCLRQHKFIFSNMIDVDYKLYFNMLSDYMIRSCNENADVSCSNSHKIL